MTKDMKRAAGEYATRFVRDRMVVGLGTGSTVAFTIRKLGEMVRKGLDIVCVPTSTGSESLARSLGIKITSLEENPRIDVTIDGADEVNPNLDLIKGMGGALVREKIVAFASKMEMIVVDETKMVKELGVKTPVPVEVLPFAWSMAKTGTEALGSVAVLRKKGSSPFLTDNGNYVLDCKFESIKDPKKLEDRLNSIPGVIENGLFMGIANKVIVAGRNGIEELDRA